MTNHNTCLFCDNEIFLQSIEHIVPESLGNKSYVLFSALCSPCNNAFSEFEEKAISRTHLSFIRIKNGIKSKKGKPGTLNIGNIKAVGNKELEKDVLKFEGLKEENISNFNPKDGSYQITIPDFHKSEMATSKMLLKMGFESIFKSQKSFLAKYNFSELKDYLLNRNNIDWPFITSHNQYYNLKSIPTFNDKYNLNKIKCRLTSSELSANVLLFDFKYDHLHLTINLLNRDYSWTPIYFEKDPSTSIYPIYLKKRL